MLSIEQGYYVVYKFLELYWRTVDKFIKYENDDFSLITIISTMDPEEIDNPNPVDSARYLDWINVISDTHKNKKIFEKKEIYNTMILYLKMYVKEFQFNLSKVIDDIQENFTVKYSNIFDEIIESIDII